MTRQNPGPSLFSACLLLLVSCLTVCWCNCSPDGGEEGEQQCGGDAPPADAAAGSATQESSGMGLFSTPGLLDFGILGRLLRALRTALRQTFRPSAPAASYSSSDRDSDSVPSLLRRLIGKLILGDEIGGFPFRFFREFIFGRDPVAYGPGPVPRPSLLGIMARRLRMGK